MAGANALRIQCARCFLRLSPVFKMVAQGGHEAIVCGRCIRIIFDRGWYSGSYHWRPADNRREAGVAIEILRNTYFEDDHE